jgi:hypothetical protein
MTKRDFLKSELLKELEVKLKNFEFRLNKSLAEFTKKSKVGWYKYQIVFLIKDEGWELKPSLLLRIDVIEDIFHETSGFEEKYRKGTPTIGTSIEDYQSDGKRYRYHLNEEDQINAISQELYLLFHRIALPFFERYNSLEKIDEAINSNFKDTALTGDIFKGSKGLIVAKLIGSGNYKELEEIYFNYYRELSGGFYLPNYKRLMEHLAHNDIK